jgi:hypothetical protein
MQQKHIAKINKVYHQQRVGVAFSDVAYSFLVVKK